MSTMENNTISNQQSHEDVDSTWIDSPYPSGYRFMPTDEELIIYYLKEEDNYPHLGNKEWYFFTQRDRRYPNGNRPKRSVEGVGWWKATAGDKSIRSKEKTNWIMHEYKLSASSTSPSSNNTRFDDWVLCRIYNRAGKLNKKIKDANYRAPLDVEGDNSLLVMQPSEDNNNNIEDVQPFQIIQNNISSAAVDQNHNHYDQGPMLMIANRYRENLHQVPANYNNQDGFNQVVPGYVLEPGFSYDMNNFNYRMPYDHQHQYFPSEERLRWQGEFEQEPLTWQGEFEQDNSANILSVEDYQTLDEVGFSIDGVMILLMDGD
ncbi:hypothetical protein OROGR_009762 [Orobanche gracilis]